MSKRIVVKVVCVVAIAIALLIPLLMIQGVIRERVRYRQEARDDVARSWTESQQLIGPVLSMPVRRGTSPAETEAVATLRALPDELRITASLRTETRKRGLYSVPVYISQLSIEGEFDTGPLRDLVIDDATFAISVSDNRGIGRHPTLVWDGRPVEIRSGSGLPERTGGMHAMVGPIDPARTSRYPFRIDIELRGMEALSFTALGRDTHVTLDAPWPHPSFTGRFLPVEHEVHKNGFHAEWRVSHLATGESRDLEELASNGFGVALINSVDIYQQATRSAKYGNLFIVITFTAFFLVEFLKRLMLHPMQYLLVGLALVIFFLLLLSLSEHVGFGAAYAIASGACVGLIGIYLSAVLGRTSSGVGMVAALGSLYGMLYAILVSEDLALLMGSLLLFALLAAVMLVTRNVDWYTLTDAFAPKGHGDGPKREVG